MPYTSGDADLVMQIWPSDGPAPFNMFQRSATNPGDPNRKDQTLLFGYNIDRGGGAYVPGEAGVGWALESHFDEGGGFFRSEFHDLFIDRHGLQNRFMTAELQQFANGTDRVNLAFNPSALHLVDPATNTRYMLFSSQALIMTTANAKIIKDVPNVCFLQQWSGTGYRCIGFVNNNRVVLGDVGADGLTFVGSMIRSEQATPATPPTGQVVQFIELSTGRTCTKRSDGSVKCFVEEP